MTPVFERQKLELETKKLEFEREKLAIEKYKARLEASKTKWTAISVAIPVVVAILTVAYGFWAAREAAKFQFQLEAAKSAMVAPTPVEANNRLLFYKRLFPSQLPDSFTTVKDEQTSDNEEISIKKEFFRTMAHVPGMTPAKAVELWNALFNDDWARNDELARAVGITPTPSPSGSSDTAPAPQATPMESSK